MWAQNSTNSSSIVAHIVAFKRRMESNPCIEFVWPSILPLFLSGHDGWPASLCELLRLPGMVLGTVPGQSNRRRKINPLKCAESCQRWLARLAGQINPLTARWPWFPTQQATATATSKYQFHWYPWLTHFSCHEFLLNSLPTKCWKISTCSSTQHLTPSKNQTHLLYKAGHKACKFCYDQGSRG